MRTSSMLVIAALLAQAGCTCGSRHTEEQSGASWKIIEQETDGWVRFDSEAGTLTLTGDAGGLAIAMSSKIPDDFPRNVPVYPGAELMFASKGNTPPMWSVSLRTREPREKVVAYYKTNMTGFQLAGDPHGTGQSGIIVWQSPQYSVTLLVVGEDGQKTTITLSVMAK